MRYFGKTYPNACPNNACKKPITHWTESAWDSGVYITRYWRGCPVYMEFSNAPYSSGKWQHLSEHYAKWSHNSWPDAHIGNHVVGLEPDVETWGEFLLTPLAHNLEHLMGLQRYCDVCGLMHPSVETFGVRRQIKAPGKPHWTTEGAGSIEMCEPCWTRIAKPKMRPWKKDTFAWRGKQQRNAQ